MTCARLVEFIRNRKRNRRSKVFDGFIKFGQRRHIIYSKEQLDLMQKLKEVVLDTPENLEDMKRLSSEEIERIFSRGDKIITQIRKSFE